MPFFSPKGEPLQNPYQLLDIEHGATDDEIAKAFKKLMLQLHPDKQPAGQSTEEAEETSEKLHTVMDAKSFLLDGDHMAAKREYDSKLVRAKQPSGGGTNNIFASRQERQAKPAKAAADASKMGGNPLSSSTSERRSSYEVKKTSYEPVKKASDRGRKPASDTKFSKKNVTKQWGRVNRSSARPVRRTTHSRSQVHDEKNDPMKNRVHTRARGKAFDDSCGDCSTTEDYTATTDDTPKQRNPYSSTTAAAAAACNTNYKPSSNRQPMSRARHNSNPGKPFTNDYGNSQNNSSNEATRTTTHQGSKSEYGTRGASYNGREEANTKRSSAVDSKESEQQQRSGYRPNDAKIAADFSNFYPAVKILEKQYLCPLTKELMEEPMSDIEGNSYEKTAILKYLETHTTSPITGNPLYSMHLSLNTALLEKIRYTVKLKSCLNSLQNSTHISPEKPTQQLPTKPPPREQAREQKYKSPREAVNSFIKDLNSASPAITINKLDSSDSTTFSYLGLKFRLEVPNGVSDNIMVHTQFEHSKKAAGISSRVVKFNASLQKMGGGKLIFRNINRKNVFTLTKDMDLEKFSKTALRHTIEYFMEMSINLHNIINTTDVIKVAKVRLINNVAVQ